MAVDQDQLDLIAGTIADLYREVENSLITTIATELKKDLPHPTAEVKLDAIRRLRAAAVAVHARLQKTKSEKVREAIRTAYRSGHMSALTSIPTDALKKIAAKQALEQVPNAALMENLAAAVHRDLGRVDGNILRAPEDAYRAVQAATAARIATGSETRRDASQAAWKRLMDRGITSFVDKSGRTWKLSSYVEMMSRTNVARAAVQGQMDRLASLGLDLVYISDNSQECKVCRPYESKVLRRDSGPIGKIKVEHRTRDGEQVTVDVLDTLDGARAKGLFHPNCRHSASAFLPGVTKLKENTADPEGDKARQKQRALERKIRKAKEQELGALTPAGKKEAGADVRAAQKKLRDHLKANPKLKRLPYREQIGGGNTPGAGGPKGGAVGDIQPPKDGGPAPKVKPSADDVAAKKAAAAKKKAEQKAAAEQAQAEAKAKAEEAQRAIQAAEKARLEAQKAERAKADLEARAQAEAKAAKAAAKAAADARAAAAAQAKARAAAEEKAKLDKAEAEADRIATEKAAEHAAAVASAKAAMAKSRALARAETKRKKEAAEAARLAKEAEAKSPAKRTLGMRAGLRHRSNMEALEWAQRELPMPDLTKEERSGLRSYTGETYQLINNGLRGKLPTTKRDKERYETIVDRCDSAFAKASTPEAMVVHRQVAEDFAKFIGANIDLPETMADLVGKDFVEKGYVSTSVGQSSPFPGAIHFMMRVPQGYKAMNVMPISQMDTSEREVLINRNSRYVVHAAYKVGYKWHIEAELVPEDWQKPADWKPDPYNDAGDGYDKDGAPKWQ